MFYLDEQLIATSVVIIFLQFSLLNDITYMYLYVPYALSSLNDFEIQGLVHVHVVSEREEGKIGGGALSTHPNIRN